MEVDLIAWVSVCTLKVGCELMAQLPQEARDPTGKFMSHDRVIPIRATEK
jgi:hypothetical protein